VRAIRPEVKMIATWEQYARVYRRVTMNEASRAISKLLHEAAETTIVSTRSWTVPIPTGRPGTPTGW